jgi:hypothetical protein
MREIVQSLEIHMIIGLFSGGVLKDLLATNMYLLNISRLVVSDSKPAITRIRVVFPQPRGP